MTCLDQKIASKWAMYQGDCVDVLKSVHDKSIGYSIFSPPFASLYTYSNSPRDMGNCKEQDNSAHQGIAKLDMPPLTRIKVRETPSNRRTARREGHRPWSCHRHANGQRSTSHKGGLQAP